MTEFRLDYIKRSGSVAALLGRIIDILKMLFYSDRCDEVQESRTEHPKVLNFCSESWNFLNFTRYVHLTIILRGRAGYEMIYNQRGA